MRSLLKLTFAAIACTVAIVLIAVACVRAVSGPDQTSTDRSMEPVVVSWRAHNFPTGYYAYNLGVEPESLSPEDEVLRCWGWDESVAEQHARAGKVFPTQEGGDYCKLVSASEATERIAS